MNPSQYKEHIINKNYFKKKLNLINNLENQVSNKKHSYINQQVLLLNTHLLRLSQLITEIHNEIIKIDKEYLLKVFLNSKLFFISKEDFELVKKIKKIELQTSVKTTSLVVGFENSQNFIVYKVIFHFESNDFIYNSCIMLVFYVFYDDISKEFLVSSENERFSHLLTEYDLSLKWKSPINPLLYTRVNEDYIKKPSFFDLFDIVNGGKSKLNTSLIQRVFKNMNYLIDNLGVLYLMNYK